MSVENFEDIPIRENGDENIVAEWWNILRRAGIYITSVVGSAATAETQQTLTNNATAVIASLVLNSAIYSYYEIELMVKRRTDSSFRRSKITVEAFFNDDTSQWILSNSESIPGTLDPSGVDPSVDSADPTAAPISYTSDNMAGSSYSGKLRWKIISAFGIEV